MEKLSFCKAVIQLLEAFHFTSPEFAREGCGLHVKTARPLENDNDGEKLLFHVKISVTCDISCEDLFKDCYIDELVNILYEMQLFEEESHLCVQQVSPDNPHRILQKGFTVECDQNNVYKVVLSGVTEKKRKNQIGSLIHIRVYLSKIEMMKEYREICHYIKLLKIFNPKMQFDTTLNIHEISCVNSYSCKYVDVTGTEMKICSNSDYHIYDKIKPMCPRIYPYCGEIVTVADVNIGDESSVNIRIQTITFSISYRYNTPSPHKHAVMTMFGPDLIPFYPLSVSSESCNFLADVEWEKYSLELDHQESKNIECCLGSGCTHRDIIHHQGEVSLSPMCGCPTNYAHKQEILHIFVIIDLENCTSPYLKTNTLRWIRHNWCTFIKANKELVQKSVVSSLDKTLHLQIKKSSNDSLYTKAINEIASAMSSVIMRSSNEDFRGTCFNLLQVDSSRNAEQQLKEKLWYIASIKDNISCSGSCSDLRYRNTGKNVKYLGSSSPQGSQIEEVSRRDQSQGAELAALEDFVAGSGIHCNSQRDSTFVDDGMMESNTQLPDHRNTEVLDSKVSQERLGDMFTMQEMDTAVGVLSWKQNISCTQNKSDLEDTCLINDFANCEENDMMHAESSENRLVEEDSEDWLNDVLLDVQDWLDS